MDITEIHHPGPQPPTGIVLEQHVVGNDDTGPAVRLKRPNDMLNKRELLVGCVCCDREVGTGRPAASLLGTKGRIGHDNVSLAKSLAIRRKRVSTTDEALNTM